MSKKNKKVNKLWGEAFDQSPSEAVIKFTAGRDVHSVAPADYQLLPYDIWVNQAHTVMLYQQKIISKKDAQIILKGLVKIEKLAQKGKFELDPKKEDVHTNIESWLIEKYGIKSAGKLHTARSRNDQTNTDTRLYLKDQVFKFTDQVSELVKACLDAAMEYQDVVMPGFTHHQHAMVTTLGHIFSGFSAMFLRDFKKFSCWLNNHNTNPLGNAVAYGTSFPIDQKLTTKLFGFDHPDYNSMDQITNRGEAEADLGYAIVSLMNHLSLFAQTFILFSTSEFGMVKIADEFSTGSSIMPQKKNPDPLEVIKGKTGYASGLLQGLLSTNKGSFIGYNRDSQWTKYLIMDLVSETLLAPKVAQGIIKTLKVDKSRMESWCQVGFIGATTLLEKMAFKYQIPFRKAKVILEKAVKLSKNSGTVSFVALKKALKEADLKIAITANEVKKWQSPSFSIKSNNTLGGSSPKNLSNSVLKMTYALEKELSYVKSKKSQAQKAKKILNQKIKKIAKNDQSN